MSCDVNLIIALILSRQLGWPIDFINNDQTCSFILVVPVSPFGSAAAPSQGTLDQLIPAPQQSAHPPLRKPAAITIDQMHKDAAEVQHDKVNFPEEPARPVGDYPECLLVSCSDLVPLFEKGLGFRCDESFLEESAINSVARAIRKQTPYKFIFVDLDDPTLLLGRFM